MDESSNGCLPEPTEGQTPAIERRCHYVAALFGVLPSVSRQLGARRIEEESSRWTRNAHAGIADRSTLCRPPDPTPAAFPASSRFYRAIALRNMIRYTRAM